MTNPVRPSGSSPAAGGGGGSSATAASFGASRTLGTGPTEAQARAIREEGHRSDALKLAVSLASNQLPKPSPEQVVLNASKFYDFIKKGTA